MKLGIIIHKVSDTNIYIVDVGWGRLRYFASNNSYQQGDIILYKNKIFLDCFDDEDETTKFYISREAWLNNNPDENEAYDSNEIEEVCRFDDCDFLGNIRFDFHSPSFAKSNIVIARRDNFCYWEGYQRDGYISHGAQMDFDKESNALLFLVYSEPRYPLPNEKDWLKAYSDARKKVEELDIPKMIEELKVEVRSNCWTRRGSDNVEFCHKYIHYNYSFHYDYLHDSYLDAIFPKFKIDLYDSKDGDIEFIHPQFVKREVIRHQDGSIELTKEQFEGMDIEDYCAIKTDELREVALKNYESYNIDEHIVSIAYSHIYWSQIYHYNEENPMLLKIIGQAKIIWGFKHDEICNKINKQNFREIIRKYNDNHPKPCIENIDV